MERDTSIILDEYPRCDVEIRSSEISINYPGLLEIAGVVGRGLRDRMSLGWTICSFRRPVTYD